MLQQLIRFSRGPALGPGLALTFLAACLAHQADELALTADSAQVFTSILSSGALAGPLGRQVAWFATAVIAIHVLLGLAAWGLARLTRMAVPLPRSQESLLTVLWLLALAGLVLATNASVYPASAFAPSPDLPGEEAIPWGRVASVLGIVIAASLLGLLVRSIALAGRKASRTWLPAAAIGVVAVGAVAFLGGRIGDVLAAEHPSDSAAAHANGRPPSIIVIGIDSLRHDLPYAGETAALTPNIRGFLDESLRFDDATTPLARTYGAWVSILSGRHPVHTGARVNLMPRRLVDAGDTLPDALQRLGYHTVFATDEVRFSNIDQSFGFQQVITPPIGAGDFLLARLNDLPLSNLLSPLPGMRWLFPHTQGNRAAYVTYRPEAFESRLEDELTAGRPTFLALHLTLAHWPYSWAGQPYTRPQPQLLRNGYRRSIAAADAQFGRVLALLERKGLLQDAVVVLLSDHGEGLGRGADSLLGEVRDFGELWGSLWGHGTSVMTPPQFQVLLAFRGYGSSRFAAQPGRSTAPASLEDISPTILDLLDTAPGRELDGLSLAGVLAGQAPGERLVDRLRFTETDFNTPSMRHGNLNEKTILNEAGSYYEVDPSTGWVQMKRGRIPEILAAKERAALYRDMLLAALPDDGGDHEYVLTSRTHPVPVVLAARPDPSREPDAARLWDALASRFGGEIGNGPAEKQAATGPPGAPGS